MDWGTSECLSSQGIATIKCVPAIIKNVFISSYAFLGITMMVMIIWAGIKFIRSRGDQAALEESKQTIVYIIIGAAIILLVFALLNVITSTTGVRQLNPFSPEPTSSAPQP